MCGISIIISKNNNNVINNVINSLGQIQNRGYDSVGIAIKNKDLWNIEKSASINNEDGLTKLQEKIKNTSTSMAIAHTRWATHGSKNERNSHPHISMNNNIILVHNGIISNFQELKNFLREKGYRFYSETDTEVIANLIEYYLKNNNIESSIKLACDDMIGTWALGIINTLEPDNIYITRHGSPLVLGYNDELIMCSSETSGFIGLIYNYINLNNSDIIRINSSGYKTSGNYDIKKLTSVIIESSPSPYEHWTLKEINDQPNTVLSAINNGARIIDDNIILEGLTNLDRDFKLYEIEHVIILGCGTSYHAAMIGKYYFNNNNYSFNTIQALDASEFSEKELPKKGKILTILCSQSGETRDLIKCIEICNNNNNNNNNNCLLLGVVNVVDSNISQKVDQGVYLNSGREIAVPSTKSFTASIIVLSLIGMWFKKKHHNKNIIMTLRKLPSIIENLLINDIFKQHCDYVVDYIINKKIQSIFILGKDKLYPISKEGALKIKEITYIHAEGYPAGSLKHGPFALLDQKTVTFLLVDEKNKDYLMSTYQEIISRDTECFIITDCELDIKTNNLIKIPKLDNYKEIIFNITLQIISYNLSIKRNINPDKPRNLAKVVTVE